MITIFEGPDGGGKTTLIEALRKRLGPGVPLYNHGPYEGIVNTAPDYFDSLRGGRSFERETFLDRAWQAEPIYGAVYRDGGDRIGVARRRMLERIALTYRAVVVYCLPSFNRCLRSWRARRDVEYLKTAVALREVHRGYARAVDDEVLPHVIYDYSRTSIDALIKRVRSLRSTAYTFAGGPGIGRFRENEVVLLVGDVSNAHTQELSRYPFVSFTESGCSAWLARKLEDAGIPESALYWINATTCRGADTPRNFLRTLKPRGIVALGANARTWTLHPIAQRFPRSWTNHPQFHKHFRSGEPYDLPELIKEFLK